MFENTMPRYEILSEESMAVLDKGWRRIVSELGIEFMKPEALDLFRAAGQKIVDNKVFLDPEFVQFHPTAIDVGLDPAPLATEALRGDGAVLVNAAGHRFMTDLHADAELSADKRRREMIGHDGFC